MTHATSTPHLSCSSLSLPRSAIRTYGKAMKHAISTPGLSCSSLSLFLFCSQEVGKKRNEAPKIGAALVVQQSSPFLSAARKGGKQWSAAPFARALRLSCNSISLFFSAVRTWGNSEAPNIDAALAVQQSFPHLFRSQEWGGAMRRAPSTPHLSCSSPSLFLPADRKWENNEARSIDAALVVQQYLPLLFCSQDMGKQ